MAKVSLFRCCVNMLKHPTLVLYFALIHLNALIHCSDATVNAYGIQRTNIIDYSLANIDDSLYAQPISAAEWQAYDSSQPIDIAELGITLINPFEGQKVQGDMDVGNLQRFVDESNMASGHNDQRSFNAVRNIYSLWPGALIPYAISTKYGSYSRMLFGKAMHSLQQQSCVQFVAYNVSKHEDFIYMTPTGEGCYSYVGRKGGQQILSMDEGCVELGTIIHEIIHAVGFFHEQSRYDRDDYVTIQWQNIRSGMEPQFEKFSLAAIDTLNEPYDVSSIMHYGEYAFSSNGRKTIEVVHPKPGQRLGQRIGLTRIDISKVNKLYKCVTQSDCNDATWRCIYWTNRCTSDPQMSISCRKTCNKC